jgi:hypothetical protein
MPLPLFLQLTDGVETVDFNDGVTCRCLRDFWTPQVSRRRRSSAGGFSAYEDADEEIAITVYGSTAAAVLATVARITRLVEQAERWSDGEAVAPVRLRFQPNSSGLIAPLEALVLGPSGDSTVSLSSQIHLVGLTYQAEVRVLLRRRGLWVGQVQAATAVATSTPGAMTATFPSALAGLHPLRIDLAASSTTIDSGAVGATYLAVAPSANDIGLASWSPFDLVGDASAVGGSVVQTESVAGFVDEKIGLFQFTLPAGVAGTSLLGVWVTVALSAAGPRPEIELSLVDLDNLTHRTETAPVTVDNTFSQPRAQFVGILPLPPGVTKPYLQVYNRTPAITGPASRVRINVAMVAALDRPGVQVLAFPLGPYAYRVAGGQPTSFTATIDPAPLHELDPVVYETGNTVPATRPLTALGDLMLSTTGNQVVARLLGCGLGATGAGDWRLIDLAGAPYSWTMTATRYRSFLTPE